MCTTADPQPIPSGNPQNVITYAGTGSSGSSNGPQNTASFNAPRGLTIDASGNVYVADYENHLIRKIAQNGTVSTIAGSGSAGSTDGQGTAASFNNPYGITADRYKNVYVTNWNTHTIRKIDVAGNVTPLAGSGNVGFLNALGLNASFNFPKGIVVDRQGTLYISDSGNNAIRKIYY